MFLRVALSLCLAAAPAGELQLGLEMPRERTADAAVFVELRPARDQVRVGEPLEVQLAIGLDSEFRERELVPLFARALDLPVEVRAPWWPAARGGRWLALPAPDGKSRTFVLAGEVAHAQVAAQELRDGRAYAVHTLSLTFLPDTPGELVLDGAELRFAYATQFDDDVFRGRVPRDRAEASVRAAAVRVRVLPLPEAGRPPQFAGAVGEFEFGSDAMPREVAVGDVVTLTLEIRGRGNFDHFAPPRVGPFDGLRTISERTERLPDVLRTICELKVVAERVREIPALEFAYFTSGTSGRYKIARTQPIPLRVRPAMKLDLAVVDVPLEAPLSPALLLGSGVFVLLLVVLFLRARARRGQATAKEHAKAADFEVGLIRPGGDVTKLFPAYLAARLGASAATVVDATLAARLVAAGVPSELAGQAAELAQTFAAATYGNKAPKELVERARAIVRELDKVAFRA
jgi:hypothetical protein